MRTRQHLIMQVLTGIILASSSPLASTLLLNAGEPSAPPVRIAVLDLQSPSSAPWLGAAVAEAVGVKLSGVDGVTLLERERVREVLLASADDPSPETLGADFLLTGSVQLAGPWTEQESGLRISARIVAAETGRLKGEASFVLDGTVGTVFKIESDLAGRFAAAIGTEASALQLGYREERTTAAKRLFGEGLVLLKQAEEAFPANEPQAATTPAGASQNATSDTSAGNTEANAQAATTAEMARGLLTKAIDRFRAAQEANEGSFYARAHHYEARARERLAQTHPEADAQTIREQTVTQFRQDAANAAPAFFDLGRALEANGQYAEAVEAYDSFLSWSDEARRVLLWEKKIRQAQFCTEVDSGRHPAKFVDRKTFVCGDRLFLLERLSENAGQVRLRLHCLAISDGTTVWTANGPDLTMPRGFSHETTVYTFNKEYVLILTDKKLYVRSAATGRQLWSLELPFPDTWVTLPESRKRGYLSRHFEIQRPTPESRYILCYRYICKSTEQETLLRKSGVILVHYCPV